MIDKDTHRFLTIFGDAKEHHMFEIIKLGSILLKTQERVTGRFFKERLLANGWVKRMWTSPFPMTDTYKLTAKGDKLFREVQVWRITRSYHDDKLVDHFRQFDRTVHGKHGAKNYGDYISEETAGLREKFPEYYGNN